MDVTIPWLHFGIGDECVSQITWYCTGDCSIACMVLFVQPVSFNFACPATPWLHFGIGDECATVYSTDHLTLHWRLVPLIRSSNKPRTCTFWLLFSTQQQQWSLRMHWRVWMVGYRSPFTEPSPRTCTCNQKFLTGRWFYNLGASKRFVSIYRHNLLHVGCVPTCQKIGTPHDNFWR